MLKFVVNDYSSLFFACILLLLQFVIAAALPVTRENMMKRDIAGDIQIPPPDVMRFMRRFGYLEPSPSDSEALYHESAIIEALKNVQKYGAIAQTGKLDSETLNLFVSPRCGVPDIEGTPYYLATSSSTTEENDFDEEFNQQRVRFNRRKRRFIIGARTWTKRRIRYFIANWSLKIDKEQIERDVARALEMWSRYSGLRFVRANDTDADIIVGFGSQYHGDNYPFDGPGNILAHAFYPYEMGSWGGDVHFDEDENWLENSTDLTNGVDFYSVVVHELGHSLGLAHSPIQTSIMFPYYKGPTHNTLDYDDTLAMYEMYLSKQLDDDTELPDVNVMTAETPMETTEVATTTLTDNSRSHTTFRGDYESVTSHKNRYDFLTPTTTTTLNPSTTEISAPELLPVPDICEGHFDAVTMINGSVHIFKGPYVWKLTSQYSVIDGYPISIYDLFPLPRDDVKRIDAAYTRYDGAIVLFTGRTYWVFQNATPIEDSPIPIEDLIGDDTDVDRVNAAMMWPKNNYTYIFASTKFWRYDDRFKTMDFGYPKTMRRWPGIPDDLDATATLANGKTYFFRANLYWLYNNFMLRPERGYPRRASTAWLGCRASKKVPLRNFNTTVSFI